MGFRIWNLTFMWIDDAWIVSVPSPTWARRRLRRPSEPSSVRRVRSLGNQSNGCAASSDGTRQVFQYESVHTTQSRLISRIAADKSM